MPHPHISRTLQQGDVGNMPPRKQTTNDDAMTVYDLTKRHLIALCEMRGVTMANGRPLARFQKKGFYIQLMKAGKHADVLSDDEIESLTSTGTE